MTSPVADFCADLRRCWRLSGRDLPGVARELRISRTQLYAILNGEIKRPPDWDALVRPLVEACGGAADLAGWRRRYDVLIRVHDELGRRSAPAGPAPAQLPPGVAGFVGRTAELEVLDGVAPGGTAVITGMPGVGKTTLAVAWGHRAASRFPDGRLYANLRGHGSTVPADPADIVRQFLDALGVPPERIPAGRDAQLARYRSLIATRRVLIVLDDASDATQVRPLLAAGRGVTVVTSRRPLTTLVADPGATPVVLRPPAESEAVELLLSRVDQAALDETAAREIVAACGGLPLALALVGARARVTGFGLGALAAELRRATTRLDALDNGALRSVFAWSCDGLSPAAARLFRLLGPVPGADITVAAAAALDGRSQPQTARTLRELTGAGLLAEWAPGRYRMHDLLRFYAAESAEDDRDRALVRLLDHYTHRAYLADRVLNPTRAPIPRGPGPDAGPGTRTDIAAARAWLAAERETLLDALRQAKDAGLDRQAWQLGWALDTFLAEQRRWHDEGAAWAAALNAATALTDRTAAAHAHCFLAVVDGRLRRFDEARDHMRRALELTRETGDRAAEAENRFTLSYVCWLLDDRDEALAEVLAALEIFTELGSTAWQGKAARSAGWYHAVRGEHTEAFALYHRALAVEQSSGDCANEALTRNCLGMAYEQIGDRDRAEEHYRHGLGHARASGDDILRAQFLTHLGDLDGARELWEEAYLILAEFGHPQAADVRHKLDGA